MAIYPTAHGYGVDYRDEFGRRRRRFVGDKQGAEALLHQLRHSAQEARFNLAQFRQAESLDLEAARDLFVSSIGQSAATREKTRKRLTLLIRKTGNLQVAQVTPRLLQEWHEARAKEVCQESLAQDSIYVRRWFRFLRDQWHLPHSPAEELDCRCPHRSSGFPLSHEEERLILQRIQNSRQWLRFCLGIDAGLRSGELARLRNGRVNMPGKEITVWPSKPGEPRIVPMTPRLHAAFIEYADPHKADPDSHVFTNHNDQPLIRPWNPLQVLRQTPNVARRRFHDLRHTFASRLATIGTPPHVIRALLGHAPTSALDLYTHASDTDRRQAIAALARYNHSKLQEAERNHTLLTDSITTHQPLTKELS
jgi:integrase